MLLRVGYGMGCYLLTALGRTFRKGRLVAKPYKNVLLRVGGGMGHYLLIALSKNFQKGETLVVCWVFF